MVDRKSEKTNEAGALPEEGVSADKRQVLKLMLGSAATFSAPLMVSFPLLGLRIGPAEAGAGPPAAANQGLTTAANQAGMPIPPVFP